MKKYKLMFSVVASITGNIDDQSYHDITFSETLDRLNKFLDCEEEPSEQGDSEYSYLAQETAIKGTLVGAAVDCMEGGERKEGFAAWASERWPDDDALRWAMLSDAQVNGVIPAREFFDMLEKTPFLFEDCETMGTIGGPLGFGCVRDVAFTVETSYTVIIGHMRATPFLVDSDDPHNPIPVSDSSWNRLKKFYTDPLSARN